MKRKKFDEVFKSMAELFKLMAHSDRLRILGLISDEEMDVSNLCKALDISQSSASQHLKLLRMNNLVTERREGKRVFYKLASPVIKKLIINSIEIHSNDLSKEKRNASLYSEFKSIIK